MGIHTCVMCGRGDLSRVQLMGAGDDEGHGPARGGECWDCYVKRAQPAQSTTHGRDQRTRHEPPLPAWAAAMGDEQGQSPEMTAHYLRVCDLALKTVRELLSASKGPGEAVHVGRLVAPLVEAVVRKRITAEHFAMIVAFALVPTPEAAARIMRLDDEQ